jgi:hypothetical protein
MARRPTSKTKRIAEFRRVEQKSWRKKKMAGSSRCQPFRVQAKKLRLPMSASVTAATAVEAATTSTDCAAASIMEAVATATVERITTARYVHAVETIVTVESAAIPVTPVATAAAIATMIPIATTIVTAAIVGVTVPRAGTDEYSIHKVIRSPVAVRCARVRRVRVVAVGAYRRPTDRDSHWSYSNPHSHPNLRARNGAHRKNQNPENHSIF